MQAMLIYNPNSGVTGKMAPEVLMEALFKAGYEPVHPSTASEEDLGRVLDDAEGLVVVAGGDGSIRAVATRVIQKNVALAPLPMGTANNICRNLGITGDPLDIVARLARPQKNFFDVGYVRAPWGEDFFLEAMGYGLYADGMAAYDPNEGKSVLRSIQAIAETLSNLQTYKVQMLLDGRDISGDYVMVEVMNTHSFGPRIKLAPQADPGDGMMDVVRIHLDERDNLFAYVGGLLREELAELPSVEMQRGRRLELVYDCSFPVHVDAEVRPLHFIGAAHDPSASPAQGAQPMLNPQLEPDPQRMIVEMIPHALELWLPEPEADGRKD